MKKSKSKRKQSKPHKSHSPTDPSTPQEQPHTEPDPEPVHHAPDKPKSKRKNSTPGSDKKTKKVKKKAAHPPEVGHEPEPDSGRDSSPGEAESSAPKKSVAKKSVARKSAIMPPPDKHPTGSDLKKVSPESDANPAVEPTPGSEGPKSGEIAVPITDDKPGDKPAPVSILSHHHHRDESPDSDEDDEYLEVHHQAPSLRKATQIEIWAGKNLKMISVAVLEFTFTHFNDVILHRCRFPVTAMLCRNCGVRLLYSIWVGGDPIFREKEGSQRTTQDVGYEMTTDILREVISRSSCNFWLLHFNYKYYPRMLKRVVICKFCQLMTVTLLLVKLLSLV